jgi:polyisoprenoid-binding protein YceI
MIMWNKKIVVPFIALLISTAANAQDLHFTRTGKIAFHASTPLEDIDATNNEVASVINLKTGEMAFTVLIKSFHFRRALMEEHFNSNFMESSKFPKSTFSGKISNLQNVDLSKDGKNEVTVEGDLTIHGVTKKVSVPGTLTVENGKINGTAKFKVRSEDYNIKIPGVVADKIAKEVQIDVDCRYAPK